MPTDVISTIGQTSSPTTPDYTSLQAWEDACPADLVSDDKRWIGECLDQGTFTGTLTIGGSTTDATRYALLRCASGASFRDKAGVRTNPLAYNSSGGVSWEIASSATNLTLSQNYTRIEGLQFNRSGSFYGYLLGGTSITRFTDCIFDGSNREATGFNVNSENVTFANCLFVRNSSSTSWDSQSGYYGCTFVVDNGTGGSCLTSRYNNALLKNCAIFGFSTAVTNSSRAGSDYNATDAGSIGGTGANNITSLTFADQFESTTNDFRAKSTGDLQAGTPDSTNTPDDITGLTRDATTPWIGCWEVAAAAGGHPAMRRLFGNRFRPLEIGREGALVA